MILNNLFESRYGASAGVETIRQLVHAVKNSADIDLKVGPEMFPVNYGDARYLLQYWKANREGGDATAEYFGDANWIEAKLAKRDHTMSPDRLKDMDQERMKSKEYDRMVGIEEYDTRPRDKEDKEAKLKALQALLVDPNTTKDPQMKLAVQKRLAQLESFFDPHEKKIPSPTNNNPVTKRVEEDDESPRKMYHKHFVKAMKAMPGSQVQKRHQLEMEKYKKMMGKSFIDQVAPKEFAKFDRKVEEGYPTDYKGWKYDVEYIEDEDTRKKLHSATKDGKRVSIDWSPYSSMTDEQFKTWIDLGMPGRKDVNSIGPLHPEDLEQLMKTKLGTRARLAQEGKPTDIELDVLKYTDEQVAKAITIARGSDGDMTGATDRIEAIANGLSNHSDVAKVLKIANEAKDDDITKKLDPKTKVALKKAQMKSAGLTKGDPIASLAYGLEKDVDRLGKENDKEEADIASQELVDKYHSQELEALKKSLTNILRK